MSVFSAYEYDLWNSLITHKFPYGEKTLTPEAVAGIMGVWVGESGLTPKILEYEASQSYALNMNVDLYTNYVDNYGDWPERNKTGTMYPTSDYKYSGPLWNHIGYGLALWTWGELKDSLLSLKKTNPTRYPSIASVNLQVDFAMQSFNKTNYEYFTSVSNVADAVRTYFSTFEMPGKLLTEYYHASTRFNAALEIYTRHYNDIPEPTIGQKIENLVTIALNEVGTTLNNTSDDHVKYNDWWYCDIGGMSSYGNSSPWCMVFLQWCMNKAKIEPPLLTSNCSQYYNAAKEHGQEVDLNSAKRGDIVIFAKTDTMFESKAYSNLIDPEWHCGIIINDVQDFDSNGMWTVEGNTDQGKSSNDPITGGAVRKVHRTYRNYIYGVFSFNKSSQSSSYNIPISEGGPDKDIPSLEIVDKEWTSQGTNLSSSTSSNDEISIVSVDTQYYVSKGAGLLVSPTLVESPFIEVKIGKYTFGSYTKSGDKKNYNVTFPNYMNSVEITKINGSVNQYVLKMIYLIEAGNDPNLLDKVFSSVGYDTIKLSYGDWSLPSFIYKEEEALITKISSRVDFSNSQISYDIYCTSAALTLTSNVYPFYAPLVPTQPSTIITDLINNPMYGLNSVFPGMKSYILHVGGIPSDDKAVSLITKKTDVLSYLNYLVSCMKSTSNSESSIILDSVYCLTIHDDYNNEYGGSYFTISKVSTTEGNIPTADTYVVDVGYPGESLVTSFTISDDQSWSLLYNYSLSSSEVSQDNYTYNIDNSGLIVQTYSPNIARSNITNTTTASQLTWWTSMTKFPVTATLTIKGLLRPSLLMQYIRINALFYGLKHISSGLYVIIKQVDKIDSTGYRTTLTLQKIGSDNSYVKG